MYEYVDYIDLFLFRRLRAGKANVALQTDFVPTKLMKEASVGPQYDLILLRDAGVLTDGQYSIKKDGFEQCIGIIVACWFLFI